MNIELLSATVYYCIHLNINVNVTRINLLLYLLNFCPVSVEFLRVFQCTQQIASVPPACRPSSTWPVSSYKPVSSGVHNKSPVFLRLAGLHQRGQ